MTQLPDYKILADFYENTENQDKRNYNFFGLIITSSWSLSSCYGLGRSRYITLPKQFTLFHKILAFILLQLKICFFVRRENQYSGYLFSHLNANKIFSWQTSSEVK